MEMVTDTDTVQTPTTTPPRVPIVRMDVVDRVMGELAFEGVKSLRMRSYWVMVHIDPPPQKVGMIWLPPTMTDVYSGMPHQKIVSATVLAAGPKGRVKPGERIAFQRLYFSRWRFLADRTMIGWVDTNQIAGYLRE